MSGRRLAEEWHQVNLWYDAWRHAEDVAAAHLGPRLDDAEKAGLITSWWFVRKGACWRLRFLPGAGRHEQADAAVEELMRTGPKSIRGWNTAIYEPEIHAFGGMAGLHLAHVLFHADSRYLLERFRRSPGALRRELGLLLCTQLMRGAGQDWYEQGDVWARVAAHRSTHDPQPPETLAWAVRQLISSPMPQEPGAITPEWATAFRDAGHGLEKLAHRGLLSRGLRAILAHHILFAWNRAGIPARDQALLASTAAQIIFHEQHMPTKPIFGAAPPHPANLSAVTDTTTPDPENLKTALIERIRSLGMLHSPRVEAAFRAVPRHLFLPGVDMETAYTRQPVITKRTEDGTAISSASSPDIVAAMLEQLDVQPGHRVLEIGTGTGINAALLQELVGPTGRITTIDIDEDIAAAARNALTTAGYHYVEVLCGDGANGHAASAPFDRIIVTAGAWDLASAWWRQLALDGRLVVPLRLHGSGLTRSIAFDLHEPDRMVSKSARVCGFVPMRGAAAHTGRSLLLADDVTLHVDANAPIDESALRDAFTYPAHVQWAGTVIGDRDPVEHLDLWLATVTNGFGRLFAARTARESGLATPALRWAGAALYDGGTIAYLALRPHGPGTNELGVIAHGPDHAKFSAQVIDLLDQWKRQQPVQPIITAYPASTPDTDLPDGYRIIRPDTGLTIQW